MKFSTFLCEKIIRVSFLVFLVVAFWFLGKEHFIGTDTLPINTIVDNLPERTLPQPRPDLPCNRDCSGNPFYLFFYNYGHLNFGDMLSPMIVERLNGHPVLKIDGAVLSGQQSGNRNACRVAEPRVFALGSLLQCAWGKDVVWSTGIAKEKFNWAGSDGAWKNLDIRSVRGPLTRQLLMSRGLKVPEIYGDPGLLLPRVFPEFQKPSKPQRAYCVITHIDTSGKSFTDPAPDHLIMTALQPPEVAISFILGCGFVISSSLHGIIVAESYGIPARWLVNKREGPFKYNDYYTSTGRQPNIYAHNVTQALEMGPAPPIQGLQKIQDNLLASFPYDKLHCCGQ